MALSERERKELLSSGAYFDALELAGDAENGAIILRVIELRSRYRELADLLSRAQTALTERREDYTQALTVLQTLVGRLGKLYGPNIWVLPIETTNGPKLLKALCWKRIEAHYVFPNGSASLRAEMFWARDLTAEMSRVVQDVWGGCPEVVISVRMIREPTAPILLVNGDSCSSCHGTHTVKKHGAAAALAILRDRELRAIFEKKEGRTKLERLEQMRSEILWLSHNGSLGFEETFSESWLHARLHSGGLSPRDWIHFSAHLEVDGLQVQMRCPQCIKEHIIGIPNGVRRGWLLRSEKTGAIVKVRRLTFGATCVGFVRYTMTELVSGISYLRMVILISIEQMRSVEFERDSRGNSDTEPDVEDSAMTDYSDVSENLQRGTSSERMAARVGRNDPCPCSSGKKYKNCCGRLA